MVCYRLDCLLQTLNILNLAYNEIYDEGALAVADALKVNQVT